MPKPRVSYSNPISLKDLNVTWMLISPVFGHISQTPTLSLVTLEPALHSTTPTVKCRTFEDNMSCVKMANNHTKKLITAEHISTKDQIADIFTKPLPKPQFSKLRDILMSW